MSYWPNVELILNEVSLTKLCAHRCNSIRVLHFDFFKNSLNIRFNRIASHIPLAGF